MKPVITGVMIVVVAGAAFFAGTKYEQQSMRQRFNGAGAGQGFRLGGSQAGRAGTRPVMGEIIEQDDKSITVKMQDGSSKIIIISASTTINKASTGSKNDLTKGQKVAVFGSENSDGSVTAQNVQLNPQMRQFGERTAQPTP